MQESFSFAVSPKFERVFLLCMNPKLSLSSARCTHSRATEPLPTCAQPLRKCDPPSPGITGGSTLAGAKGTCISKLRRGSLQPARRVASVRSAPAQALQFSLEVGSSAFPAAHSPPGPTTTTTTATTWHHLPVNWRSLVCTFSSMRLSAWRKWLPHRSASICLHDHWQYLRYKSMDQQVVQYQLLSTFKTARFWFQIRLHQS